MSGSERLTRHIHMYTVFYIIDRALERKTERVGAWRQRRSRVRIGQAPHSSSTDYSLYTLYVCTTMPLLRPERFARQCSELYRTNPSPTEAFTQRGNRLARVTVVAQPLTGEVYTLFRCELKCLYTCSSFFS